MPNLLAAEASPYLQQHAGNPVDWYPWGPDAFEKARREEKPIFLSVGYSTCHWCHVMERESFESHDIAALLNEHFVSVKVDREERPDVDRVYMSFVQATTGSGGWPMSVWLTPDLKPFYGGTYFPPRAQWGRPGFADLLREIARVWQDERARVQASAEDLIGKLREATSGGLGPAGGARPAIAGREALASGVDLFRRAFDARHGGFGGAPKFPRPSEILFLLRSAGPAAAPEARDMALATLRAMALGGLRDHIGGGFHRYAVDAEWRVPHFEKMLYDQAQLVLACLEAAQATGDPFWAAVAWDTLDYVRRDLTDRDGGFYSAEDADSVPPELAGRPDAPRTEGAFYLWTDEELARVLGGDADVVRARFGIGPEGNAPADPHGEFRGRNILYVARDIAEVARLAGQSAEAVVDALDRARGRLFEVRAGRPRPHLDDKILTAWNGLMIAAFARAARVVAGEPGDGDRAAYLEVARRAAAFVHARLWRQDTGTLLRRYRDGRADIEGYCEDYAFLIWGLLELFQADADPRWLAWAQRLQARQDELFWDDAEGGWFSTSGRDPSVLLRLKEDHDGAEPSASSVSVLNVLALAHLTGAPVEKAERTLARVGDHLGSAARVVPMLACGLAAWHEGGRQIIIVGPRDREDTQALGIEAGRHYLPSGVTLVVEPGAHQAALAARMPAAGAMSMRDDRATAYVCRDFACHEPVVTTEALRAQLTKNVER